MIISEIEGNKICRKRRLILKTAQIKNLRAVLDASDYRNWEAAKICNEAFKRAACTTLRARPDREAGAWDGL